MRCSYLETVARDADGPYQSLLSGLDSGIDYSSGTERYIPLDGIDKVMQLPQVYIIDIHAFQ